ncbi:MULTISPECIES: glutamate racemase [unclassified Pseudodesulfovibrio]|uniref:glutamate racemase n=1 Tax=unclassified Pseudodesulfovibrio TaxID=2661612 RepID=UPI000FEBF0A0|nr:MULTISPECIES: glutamate racemase [unclassified Pseudodesulfovibrio]MCJ2165986.1 glutamate racemase [Pseudodesulfovibrio sp. S3-i]RWU02576.1 glutamate racemase [Pseudodesulfovibrio sp. S3]
MKKEAKLPIGMFDSGVGGLTVLKAVRERMPCEDVIYLGDTARLPYGTKSPQTVTRYGVQCGSELIKRGIKLLVVACNTASAVALDALRAAYPEIPVVGVVDPGARAACAASKNRAIAVIATESTIARGAYQRAIHAIAPTSRIFGHPCPLFVALAEEGWTEGQIPEAVAARYLDPVFKPASGTEHPVIPDTLVLGCTHFPLLASAIRKVVPKQTTIVDSAATTAETVFAELTRLDLIRPENGCGGSLYLTTDDAARFARTGTRFLGTAISEKDVELVDL